jgi:hypothetical protein
VRRRHALTLPTKVIATWVTNPDERLRLVRRIANWADDAVAAAEAYKESYEDAEAKDRLSAAEEVLRQAETLVKSLVDQEAVARASRCALEPTDPAWVDAVTLCTALGAKRMAAEAESVTAAAAVTKARGEVHAHTS